METQLTVSKQLDYKKESYSHPTYRLSKLLPLSGSQTVGPISIAGGNETLLEIPVQTFNLAQSHLCFTITPSASGAGNFNWHFMDTMCPIRQIQLYTRAGIYLADLNFVGNYTNSVLKAEIKLDEYLTLQKQTPSNDFWNYLGAYNSGLVTAPTPGVRFDGTSPDVVATETYYLEPGGNNGANPVFSIGIPLRLIKNTIFSLDKDLYTGEVLVLRIVWEGSNRVYTVSTNVAQPQTGAVAFNGTYTITNLALYLAIEKNQSIVNGIMQQITSTGLQILIPYVYGFKNNFGAGTSQTVSLRLNRGHGSKLMKIYHSIYNNTETANTAYDHDARANGKVQVYYTMLNNERQQEYNMTTATYDDYLLLKDKLKNSVIQSSDMYYFNWFWLEDWTNSDKLDEKSLSQNLITGLDLSVEQRWDFYGMTMANLAYNHYSFAVTQKTLTVSSSGITVL